MLQINTTATGDVPDSSPQGVSRKWQPQTLVFLAIAFVYGCSLFPRTFWSENEAFYALGAKSVLTGHFLLPVIYNDTFADKPPLMFWWVALISKLFGGVSEFSARLANLVPSMVTLFFLFRFARPLAGEKVAILAVLLLATSKEFFQISTEVNTDLLLTALLMISWTALYRIIVEGFTWKRWLALWGAMSLGFLTKGPIAPGLTCLVAMTFSWWRFGWREGWRRLFRLKPIIGSILCFVPFSLWCFAVYRVHGGEPLKVIILQQNFERFAHAFDHREPWYFYTYTILGVMIPWTVLFPAMAIRWWRARKRGETLADWQVFACSAVAVIFVFFSLSSSKRGYYLLPLMPWLCLLLADTFCRLGEAESALKIGRFHINIRSAAIAALGLVFLYFTAGYRWIDSRRTPANLVKEIERTSDNRGKLLMFEEEDPRLMYYVGKNLIFLEDSEKGDAELKAILSSEAHASVVVMRSGLRRMKDIGYQTLYVKGSEVYRQNRYFIVTTNADDGVAEFPWDLIADRIPAHVLREKWNHILNRSE